jgi:PPOX class probable F420-dependent enzyme
VAGRSARLLPAEARFLAPARRAVLATIAPNGRPRLVPVCFVLLGDGDAATIYSPLDEKPKRVTDPRGLARVRDLLARPEVTLLVDRWDEDWDRLAWLRVHGRAELVEPAGGNADERATAIATLRAKYPQYVDHDLEARPLIRIGRLTAVAWGPLDAPRPGAG